MASSFSSSRPASRGPSSPMPNSQPPPEEPMSPPVPRLMQVKVLYSFDGESKTNCLARCRQPQNIQAVNLDGRTQIGIVQLRTCIDAILHGSPELIPKLGQDYTVYAYDYSEYETPLVGQGMLSRVLAAASSTPTAPAHESRTMVTGRVCRNVLGLFSDGARETLEVKLKLVPVPTCLQDEYVSGMEKYRDSDSLVGEGFDTEAWSDLIRANPGLANMQQLRNETSQVAEDRSSFSNQSQSTSQSNAPAPTGQRKSAKRDVQLHNHFICYELPQTTNARPITPSQQPKSKPQSRPSSRASNRAQSARRQSVSDATGSQAEDGPAKKRARTTKTDWHGSSAFGQTSESLRVAASTAASMRGLNTASTHPSASDIAAGELGMRPPTPRPDPVIPKKQRGGLKRSKTALAHDAITHSTFDQTSPQSTDFPLPESAIALSSPERDGSSIASTPFDMPSSPPVMPTTVSPTPSSPALPQLRHHPDSGFASGTPDECLDHDMEELRPLEEEEALSASCYGKSNTSVLHDISPSSETHVDPGLIPRKILPRPAPRRVPLDVADGPGSSPKLPPLKHTYTQTNLGSQQGLDMQTSKATSNASNRRRRESYSVAEAPSMPDGGYVNAMQGNEGSGLKRKKKVQDALLSSITAGEMPRFCNNCGEIDTPTWRKAFVRIETGSPDHLQLSENDEGITAWEVLDKDDDGVITSYRIIKKNVGAEEKESYEEIPLCNPCGMWLYKQKSMRPYEVWNKAAIEAAQPKKKIPPKKKRLQTKEKDPTSDAGDGTGRPALDRTDSNKTTGDLPSRSSSQDVPEAPRKTSRSGSVDLGPNGLYEPLLDQAAAAAALEKAFKSSPPRFPGSKQSPINIDGEFTPHSTRRTLFPSPRRPGEIKSLEEKDVFEPAAVPPRTAEGSSVYRNDNKENRSGGTEKDANPGTPKSCKSDMDLLKTPSFSAIRKALSPKGFLSSAARRWREGPETPSRVSLRDHGLAEMTPFTAQLCQLLSDANQSPSRGNDLSVLFGDQPMHDQSAPFAFSDFSAEDFAVDLPMATSTSGVFSLYEDPVSDTVWNSEGLMESSAFAELVDDEGADPVDEAADAS